MGVHKRYLHHLAMDPDSDRWRDIVPDAETREQALEAIEAHPTEIIATCNCAKAEDGSCTGEPAPANDDGGDHA